MKLQSILVDVTVELVELSQIDHFNQFQVVTPRGPVQTTLRKGTSDCSDSLY